MCCGGGGRGPGGVCPLGQARVGPRPCGGGGGVGPGGGRAEWDPPRGGGGEGGNKQSKTLGKSTTHRGGGQLAWMKSGRVTRGRPSASRKVKARLRTG